MSEPLWLAIITTAGAVLVGYFSYLASRRARLAKEIAEEIRASISTTNSGSHLKDDIEDIKQSLATIKVALVQVQGGQSAQARDIERLEREDAKRAAAASEAHGRIHERIDELAHTRRGWRR